MSNMEIRVDKGKVRFVTVEEGKENNYIHFGYIRGNCKWAKVLAPDQYDNFAIDIFAEEEVLKEFTQDAKDIIAEARELVESVNKKVAGEADVTKTTEDGKEYVQFKRKGTKYTGEPNTPPKIINKYGDHEPEWDKLVGNDSEVKVGYYLQPYYMASTKMVGVSLKFYAVQVINLVEYDGGSGTGSGGFGDESDGSNDMSPTDGEEF